MYNPNMIASLYLLQQQCPVYAAAKATKDKQAIGSDMYPLDPSSPMLLSIIKGVLKQLSEVFTSKYLHIGGDEVDMHCWEEGKRLQRRYSGLSMDVVFAKFEGDVFSIVRDFDKIPMVWQGVSDYHALPLEINESIATKSIIQPWKCWGGLAVRSALSALKSSDGSSHPVVQSACWYLDFNWDIDRFLSSDMLKAILSSSSEASSSISITKGVRREYSGGVYGGEASMWTENVDFTNLICRIWPRVIGAASMLWGTNFSTPLQSSMEEMRESLALLSSELMIKKKVESKMMLYTSYASFHRYLETYLSFNLAPLTFHIPVEPDFKVIQLLEKYNPERNDLKYIPKIIWTISEFFTFLYSYFYLSDAARLNITSVEQAAILRFRLNMQVSCQCSAISQRTTRPFQSELSPNGSDGYSYVVADDEMYVSLVQLNTADGSQGPRRDTLITWLQYQSFLGVNIISICEANKWEELEESQGIEKNRAMIEKIAADGGYAYSYVANFTTRVSTMLSRESISGHPYSIGVMSSLPFQVLRTVGPPVFQRGIVHAYFAILDLHLFVVHLHAHSSISRQVEALRLVGLLKPLLINNKRVVVAGDFNTLNPMDALSYDHEGLLKFYQRTDHQVFSRLRKKYCKLKDRNGTKTMMGLELDYRPMQTLLDSGLIGSCESSCGPGASDLCIASRCGPTEPTAFDFEWPKLMDGAKQKDVRLDYIFLSKNIIQCSDRSLYAGVQRNNDTSTLSDHYPLYVSWKQSAC